MNIQDAYKKLDLAKGLNRERVESQYQNLKTELEPKISGTQNERLKQVYTNRLDEVEQAYAILIAHFEDGAAEVFQKVNPVTEVSDFSPKNIPVQQPKKKRWRIVGFVLFGLVIIAASLFLINSEVFAEEEVDNFRKMEGEKQVFVNNLTLRQYPDAKSSKIEVFPLGTRLFYDQNENPKTDDKNRVWRKVRVIHPVYGWDRPNERLPYPYEGWMAVEECGVPWVEDSLTTANLLRILGNDDAGRSITSSYRHGLVEFFQQNNYFDEWIIYGSDKKDKLQKVMLTNLGNSEDDCNGDDQSDLVAIMNNQNNGNQKLIVLSTDRNGKVSVIYEDDAYDTEDQLNIYNGMRKLSSSQLRSLRRKFSNNIENAIVLQQGVDEKVLFIENGSVRNYYNY